LDRAIGKTAKAIAADSGQARPDLRQALREAGDMGAGKIPPGWRWRRTQRARQG